MSAVIVGAAVVGVVGSAVAANGAKQSANKANEANAKNVADTNALNKQMFDESRGSTGHAFLPTYTGDAEKNTFNDLYGIYQSGLTPEERQAQAQGVINEMAPSVQGGNDYLNGVYSGKNLQQSQAYYQPLWDARTQAAQAQVDAIQQAYAKTRSQNLATAMRQGYYGGSSVQSNEQQKAMLDAIQSGAMARSNAQMQNAGEGAQLGINDLARRQQLLSEPISRGQQLVQYQNLPSNAAYGGYDNLANRLGLFNIGKGQFTYQNQPIVQPNINSGQVAGAAIGTIGQLGMQYGMANAMKPASATTNGYYQPTNTFQGNSTPAASNAASQATAGSNSFWGS